MAMAAQFNADAVTLGWITSAYIVSASLFIVPFSRRADICGCKKDLLTWRFDLLYRISGISACSHGILALDPA